MHSSSDSVALASPSDRASAFFVKTATPPKHKATSSSNSSSPRERRAELAMGEENAAPVDFLNEPTPVIDLRLLSVRFLFHVVATIVFYTAFTVVFYIGVPVETVYEPIGTSKKAEARVEVYNTYSGYAMALVEVLVAMHTDKIMPVLDVYVHNALYFLQRKTQSDTTRHAHVQATRRLHSTILFVFPILLALTMGNSLRGLQAGQSSDGFRRIMVSDDLKMEQPAIELIKANATALSANATAAASVNATILRNAIAGQSTPFEFNTQSPCGQPSSLDSDDSTDKTARVIQINVHELDSTSAVYGFVPQEWNGEAMASELVPTSSYTITFEQVAAAKNPLPAPSDFSLATAFELMIQGQIAVERAQADGTTASYPCTLSDGRGDLDNPTNGSKSGSSNGTETPRSRLLQRLLREQGSRRLVQQQLNNYDGELVDDSRNQWTYENGVRQCQGAVSAMLNMGTFYNPSEHTPENLVYDTRAMLAKTLRNLSIAETTIVLEKYDLTPQIQLEVMEVDIPIDKAVSYGLNAGCEDDAGSSNLECDPTYSYETLQESFCGSNGCAFLDMSGTFRLQREIAVLPYVTNCTLDVKHVHYSADFRGYLPSECTRVANSAFLYGIGSYIVGDEYGSNETRLESYAPYITNARRHVRLTYAKATWQTEDLADKFNAKCGNGKDKVDCKGIWYKLQSSGRFLFAGESALPTSALAANDFHSPITLVQLNSPTLYIDKFQSQATLEPLATSNFKTVKWDKNVAYNGSALGGDKCSMLIDSYLDQVATNNYMLEQPLQAMYTAFFYYFMQNAAVTQLNDTSVALNGTNLSANALSTAIRDPLGNVKLTGDQQERSIRVSIPTSSFFTSLAGCILIVVLMGLVVFIPAPRVEHFDEGTPSAQEFLAIRSDKAYPDGVHTKKLVFAASGESVQFDELAIDRMTLVHETERDRHVHL